ncbi:MAG: hypothetical protein HFJ20_06260 [Clostridia bacterium]|nr:hypothetical protein [Clostridia bacterium]
MILVLLGTQNNSFHRLLEEIQEMVDKEIIKDKVVVQAGYTQFSSKNMQIFDFIPLEKMSELQEQASLIITHGGVGSIISPITKGKKVIAVPRLHKYSEHVNDHQKEIIKTFNDNGFIIGIENVEDLEEAFRKSQYFKPQKYESNTQNIIKIVQDFIDND